MMANFFLHFFLSWRDNHHLGLSYFSDYIYDQKAVLKCKSAKNHMLFEIFNIQNLINLFFQ
jgi:hypothetical protein